MNDMLRIVSTEYMGGLSLRLTFSDGFVRILDFTEYMLAHPHPQHDPYLNPNRFREYYIDSGNLVWGEDWDMIFPVEDLYDGNLDK